MKEAIDADVLKLTVADEKPTKSMFRFVWGDMQIWHLCAGGQHISE